jgi:uncharacterized membrane protein YgcG
VSKLAAPNGLTEEFLLRYRRFGHHNDSDIIDSLTEYWTDWGGFDKPIFPNQDLFPWDCTEARSQEDSVDEQPRCGDCKPARHLWAFPFDSWSISQLHLFRERGFYAPINAGDAKLRDKEWMQNRVRVLEAIKILGEVAAAMSKSDIFRSQCPWVFKFRAVDFPHARRRPLFGRKSKPIARQPRPAANFALTDRVKLAGIHRAQPMSHVFEHDVRHDCTLADWADLVRDDQVAAYTDLRNLRATFLDEILEAARQSQRNRRGQENPSRWDNQRAERGDAATVLDDEYCSSTPDPEVLDPVMDGGPSDDEDSPYTGTEDSTYSGTMDPTYDGAADTDALGDQAHGSGCDCLCNPSSVLDFNTFYPETSNSYSIFDTGLSGLGTESGSSWDGGGGSSGDWGHSSGDGGSSSGGGCSSSTSSGGGGGDSY